MEKLTQGLNFLLKKYSINKSISLKNYNKAIIDGKTVPLLAHRHERRFTELKNIVSNGTLEGISVMRISRIVAKDKDIFEELYRELDICQFVLNKSIVSITALQNDNTLNVIATTENGIVCTLEIAATLQTSELPKDKHEIIAKRGTACDVVVDTQLKPDSIYLFGTNNKSFTDVDFELYGLSAEQIAVVRAAFDIAQKDTTVQINEIDKSLKILVEKAKLSVQIGERQVV